MEVSVSDPECVRRILVRPLDKHTWYKIFAMPDSSWANQMSELSAQKFSVTQKKIAGGYALSNVIKAEPELDQAIQCFQYQIDRLIGAGRFINLDVWFTYFAFDVVGQITFSQEFGFLQQGKDVGKCIATSHILVPYLSIMAHFYQYHDLIMSNTIMAWLDLQPMKHVMETTVRAIQERERNGNSRIDMIEHWKSHSEPLTDKEILSTASANVAAGADTVASELQAFVYLLLRHPDCLRCLRAELDAAALNHRISVPAQYNAVQDLPYFQACVSYSVERYMKRVSDIASFQLKETYRFHPVSATSYPRVTPKEGIEIAGRYFPSGVRKSTSFIGLAQALLDCY